MKLAPHFNRTMNNPSLIHRRIRIRMMGCFLSLWLVVFLSAINAFNARAALILDLPELTLQPNQPGQSFTISVQNTGASVDLNGVQLDLIIGNGVSGAPAFQAVTLLGPGSLFASNNTGDRGGGDFGGLTQVFQRFTSTSSGTVTLGTGTFDLATVTFDTTGVGLGGYSWSAATSPNGLSFFTDTSPGGLVFPTLLDGTLSVVPEPVNAALPIFGGLLVLIGGMRFWCRRRARTC